MYNLKNKISAVLFDMDGVLIDSNAVIEGAWREAAEMYGKTISEEDIVRHIHGQPGPHTIQALFSDLSLNDRKKFRLILFVLKILQLMNPLLVLPS